MAYTKSKIKRIDSDLWDYWKVSERKTNGVNGFEIHYSEDGECITDHVYTKEDADLIASAPLLLETLKYLDRKGGLGLDVHDLIRKVVDIAEGETT